jgi:hypothetical protein
MSEQWVPKPYMKRAMQFLLEQGGAGLLLDPGLGKTSISLGAFKVLKKAGLVKCMLVVAPLRPLYLTWPGELRKWSDFEGLSYTILHGDDKLKELRRSVDVYLINPEGLLWLLQQREFSARFRGQLLVIDESTKFKNTQSERFKILRPALPLFSRRWILTGTPAPNGLMDLFGQVYIIDLGHALGGYITHYRQRYFSPGGYGGYSWALNNGAEEQIYEQLKPLCLRMSATDYLKLPPISKDTDPGRTPRYIDLPPAARRAYDKMEVDLLTKLEKGTVVAANAAVATMKCRQIANGGLYYDEGVEDERVKKKDRRWQLLHDAKTEAVKDLLEELSGQPTLVTYDFDHDKQRLLKALGVNTPWIGRGVVGEQLRDIERRWNRGEIPYLLVNPASASHGTNLQGAGRAVIWHSLTWNYEDYDQLIKRIWRQGQTKRVFVHHIIARNTIEETILFVSLAGKAKTQNKLLDALKSTLRARHPR